VSPTIALLTLSLFAQAGGAPAKLLLDFAAERADDAWVASAFEENAARDLAGHRAVQIEKRTIDTTACTPGDEQCRLARYADAGIDLILMGFLTEHSLEIEVYEGWLETRIATESIDLDDRPTLVQIRERTLRAVIPFFGSGGLLERRHWIQRGESEDDERLSFLLVLGALLASGLFLSVPLMIGRLLGVRPSIGALRTTLRLSAVLPLALIAAALVRAIDGADWLLPMAGGAAWSWFLILLLRVALPTITGLSSIRHGMVGRMLRAWCVTAAMRLGILASLFGPFVFAVAEVSVRLGVSERTAWIMLVPLCGLLLHFWLASLVEQLSRHLDRALVIGKASAQNPWHPVARKYFMGYVRRAGLEIDRSILDRTLFLPGKKNEIVSYGGQLSHARIVIPEALLETALHPLSDDPLIDEDGALALDLGDPSGLLLPGAPNRRPKPKRDAYVPPKRRQKRPLLGQNETLLGYVVPMPKKESIPLVIDDPDEYSVLRDLLTAHYSAFDPKLYGEEADDTDPTQKDFLFGALLREIGGVQRQDGLSSTPLLCLGLWIEKGPKWLRAIERTAGLLYRRFLARYPETIADGYAALNRGLHHLIQYLDHLRTGAEAGLTARADEPTLASTSAEVLRRVAAESGSPDDHTRNRLVWLSQHLFAPIPESGIVSTRLVVTTALVLGITGVVASAVVRSLEYRPVYRERMQELRQKIEEARKKGELEHGQ
jgi:hypothetical protein